MAHVAACRDGLISVVAEHLERVYYDVANRVLMAQFDGLGGVSRLAAAGIGTALVEDSAYVGLALDGRSLPPNGPKQVSMSGTCQVIRQEWGGVDLRVECFTGENDPGVFVRWSAESSDGREHRLALHVGWTLATPLFATEGREPLSAYDATVGTLWAAPNGGCGVAVGADALPARWRLDGVRAGLEYALVVPAGGRAELTLVWLAMAPADDIAQRWLQLAGRRQAAWQQATARAGWLQGRLRSGDPELDAMFAAALNCSLSAYKHVGEFRGFFAGVNYQWPLRTYYRDAYWTCQAALPFAPEFVREEVLTLARGVHPDGQCPSAVMLGPGGSGFTDFWPDHYDSPALFLLLLYDYLAWTGDMDLLQALVGGSTVWQQAVRCLDRLARCTGPAGLPVKPERCRRDWADNVFRDGVVAYVGALYARACACGAELAAAQGEAATAATFAGRAAAARAGLQQLWSETGYLIDYRHAAHAETHLALDTIVAPLFGLLPPEQRRRLLARAEQWLQTRHNAEQPYGDWGVLCCWPPYGEPADLVEKSVEPYRYHNGSDWPYLDGLYALCLLEEGDPQWRYPLLRWFTYGLSQGWYTPVEYYAPPHGRGSLLQAWSSVPAAAVVMGGFGLRPDLAGRVRLRIPPWGRSRLQGIRLRGYTYDLAVQGTDLHVWRDGQPIDWHGGSLA